MTENVTTEKPFKLLWTSQDETLTFDGGDYTSIPEASADRPAAEERLQTTYPDIKGTWHIVGNAPTRPMRGQRS